MSAGALRGLATTYPWHSVPVLARKPGALRNGAPFKNWVLPAGLERVRRKLVGAADGDRQFVDILTAVLSDGLPAVEAACQEALGQGVHSADVILNILARRREPAAPITIAIPDALRLRHAPAADCARYDRLLHFPSEALRVVATDHHSLFANAATQLIEVVFDFRSQLI